MSKLLSAFVTVLVLSVYSLAQQSTPVEVAPAGGTGQILRAITGEAGAADFHLNLTAYPNAASLMRDNVFSWGYNIGPQGKLVPGEHQWGFGLESRGLSLDTCQHRGQGRQSSISFSPAQITA